MTLPPKRFEDQEDPKFDSIRHFPWFRLLAERRDKLPWLKAAYAFWIERAEHPSTWLSQEAASAEFGVDMRELRDYANFVAPLVWEKPLPEEQKILDIAYHKYTDAKGSIPFPKCIGDTAWSFGLKHRHVLEKWDVDPTFYPTGYVQKK